MKIGLNLKPGEKGTKKLERQYGKQLVCIRYRYDEKRKKRLKTIELIIEEVNWETVKSKINEKEKVCVKVSLNEKYLQRKIKSEGGTWNRKKQLWEIAYGQVVKLGLKKRIVSVGND